MTQFRQSKYIRVNKGSTLLRKWIARLLLRVDLEDYLFFERIERSILAAFRTAGIEKENLDDANFVRNWLVCELEDCTDVTFDENDVFAINTRLLKELMGLNETELSILRFAILLNCCRPLEMVAEIHGNCLNEIDLSELLHDVLGEPFDAVYQALNPTGRLLKSGLLKSRCVSTASMSHWLTVPDVLLLQVFRAQESKESLEHLFYLKAPRSKLALKDFRHLEPNISLIKDYLKTCYRNNESGTNILLWGPPGTGKTELARYLAQSIRKQGLEISTYSREGRALDARARFDSYCLCQAIVGKSKQSLVIYDEVEEILSDASFADYGFKRSGFITKGTINKVLENNEAPAIWVTNTLLGVDPAYLRRFDLVLKVKTPAIKIRKRMVRNSFKHLPIDKELIEQISRHEDITPAHLHKASKICARLGIADEKAQSVVQQVLNSDLEAIWSKPLETKTKKAGVNPTLTYRPELINSDLDLTHLCRHLTAESSARICLYGPPGTGKTAWGHYLAQSLNRPLLVKRAADIFDSFLGNTEKNIASAFSEAEAVKGVLLLDEVDSFLQDRSCARQHWEVAQVNQFLTSMENYNGILICTTNLLDSLDRATLRRFDFKVEFDFLKPEQAEQMCINLFKVLGTKQSQHNTANLKVMLSNLTLTHGDFASVYRRYQVLELSPTLDSLIKDLRTEAAFRDGVNSPAIGFTAQV